MLTSILHINGLLDLFGKTHPAVAHFPVALLLTALLAELSALKFKRHSLHTTAKFCLFIGTFGALLTTLSGFPFTQATFFNARPPLLVKHQLVAYSVVLLGFFNSGIVWASKENLRNNKIVYSVYLFLLLIIAALVIHAGHTGGMLVYGEDFFNLPAPTP